LTIRHLLLFSLAYFAFALAAPAAEEKILFQDSFDGKLGEGWTWLRENPDSWRIGDGALEIRVEPGVANTVKNALLRPAPDRSKTKFAVMVTTTFTSHPIQQYEQAGITWYHDQKPVFKLVHELIDGDLWVIPGRVPARAESVQLRLVVDGQNYKAQFRKDMEDEFQTVAEGELPPPGNDQISLQCYNGPADAEHWIRFEDFQIVELAK
jgi:regulation of enolase protein 1 (concanavalin A-like superfamily)